MEHEGNRALSPHTRSHLVPSRISEQCKKAYATRCYTRIQMSLRIVKQLLSPGLVQMEPAIEDERRQVVIPTGQGSLTVVKGRKIISHHVERWFSRLTEYESTEILSNLISLNSLMR